MSTQLSQILSNITFQIEATAKSRNGQRNQRSTLRYRMNRFPISRPSHSPEFELILSGGEKREDPNVEGNIGVLWSRCPCNDDCGLASVPASRELNPESSDCLLSMAMTINCTTQLDRRQDLND